MHGFCKPDKPGQYRQEDLRQLDVVQPGRTLVLGTRGRWFKSSYLDFYTHNQKETIMATKPKKYLEPTVGIAQILSKGNNEFVFMHLAGYLTKKEADNLEKLGHWIVEAAQYLKRSDKESGSHRDR